MARLHRPGELGSEIGNIQVLHNVGYMKSLMVKRVLSAIIPLILMMPLSLLVIWLVVRAITRDLRVASRQIAAQETLHPHSVSPDGLPDEVLPLVDAYNSLLDKLRAAGRHSASSLRMPHMNCARRSPPSRYSWRTCVSTSCRAKPAASLISWKRASRARAIW